MSILFSRFSPITKIWPTLAKFKHIFIIFLQNFSLVNSLFHELLINPKQRLIELFRVIFFLNRGDSG
jgi:hypothetical protein